MTTPSERAEQKRREKLALIQEQVESGELTIKKMTPAERERFPAQPRPPAGRRPPRPARAL
jgi:hypothetical protein